MISFILRLIVTFLLILGAGLVFLYKKSLITPDFFSKDPPLIKIVQTPLGVGTEPVKIRFNVSSLQAGLDEVVVRGEQGAKHFDLFQKSYKTPHTEEEVLEMPLVGQEQGLKEGQVALHIVAWDRSFFSNRAEQKIELPVNYRKPKLEVLTPQHNVNQGGIELAFYRLLDNSAVRSGIQVGDKKFSGYAASLLSPEFEAAPNVYFSFFAVPLDFDADKGVISAFAENNVGNINNVPFYYKVVGRHFRSREVSFSDSMIRNKLGEVLKHFNDSDSIESLLEGEDLAASFKSVMDKLEQHQKKDLEKLSLESVQHLLWKVPFGKPMSLNTKVPYGEKRTLWCNGNRLGEFRNEGVDLLAAQRSAVIAASNGRVIYAGYFGSYGNTVILDHGFGLLSLYAHLSTIEVQTSSEIKEGVEIARSGTSGLGESDTFHFEVRLHGAPINPLELWDARWLHEHILSKIRSMLELLTAHSPTETESE